MIAIAPSDVITVFKSNDSWVIAILKSRNFWVVANPFNGVRIDLPIDSIFTEACMQVHDAPFVVNAENSRVTFIERNDGAVENAICPWDSVSGNDRVFAVTPNYIATIPWSLFPRERSLLS